MPIFEPPCGAGAPSRRRQGPEGGPSPVVASAVLSKKESKPELKRLATADISQRLLVRPAKELIAQPEPAAQLLRGLCCRTRPMLPREACVEFRKRGVLSKGEERNPRTFRHC